jgi:undecaprenyl-diphosphatase
MAKARVSDLHKRAKGRVLLLILFLLLIYVVVPRLGNFSDSIDAIKDARFGYVALGALATVGTYILAAGIYQSLALRPLRFRRTMLVQTANGFANRLLPAGLGGLALNIQYLKKSGHTLTEALVVAGMNNTLGMVGHTILLLGILIFGGSQLVDQHELPHVKFGGWIALAILMLVVVNILVFRKLRRHLYTLSADVWRNVMVYRKKPASFVLALLLSVGLTCAYVMTFYLCGLAVDIDLPIGSMFAVFTVGLIATTATPTPGGLGGAEAGLVAGLVAFGVDASTGLACVLLYRLLTYWLPLLPGFAVFLAIRKKYL